MVQDVHVWAGGFVAKGFAILSGDSGEGSGLFSDDLTVDLMIELTNSYPHLYCLEKVE